MLLKLNQTLDLGTVKLKAIRSDNGCVGCFYTGTDSGLGSKHCKNNICAGFKRPDKESIIFKRIF
jgi:hypothetical protein